MVEWGSDTLPWLLFGFLGNIAFGARFLVQWIASERAGESVIPMAFWYLSVVGSLILLVYAIHIKNPVMTIAFLPNGFVYLRNIALVKKKEREAEANAAASG